MVGPTERLWENFGKSLLTEEPFQIPFKADRKVYPAFPLVALPCLQPSGQGYIIPQAQVNAAPTPPTSEAG